MTLRHNQAGEFSVGIYLNAHANPANRVEPSGHEGFEFDCDPLLSKIEIEME